MSLWSQILAETQTTDSPMIILGSIAAVVAAVAAVGAMLVPVVLRYRDRIDVRITAVRIQGGALIVSLQNDGGTPTVVKGTRFVVIGAPPPTSGTIGPGYGIKLAGRDIGELVYPQPTLADECPAAPAVALAAVEESGKVSKLFQLDGVTLAWIRAGRA